MNKNSKIAIKIKNAKFNDSFCSNKFLNSNKCLNFYLKNLNESNFVIKVCPYGYACIFAKNSIVSSVIDEKNCNITLIRRRVSYPRKHNNYNSNNSRSVDADLKIITNDELHKMIEEEKKSKI